MKSAVDHHKEFWSFSLDRYGRNGVSALCLELQDKCGADVNILLFCLWRGQEGQLLDASLINSLIAGEAGQWHRDVVLALRSARKAMKGQALAGNAEIVESFRDKVKKIEIESEKLEQLSLAAVLASLSERAQARAIESQAATELAAANAASYLGAVAPDDIDGMAVKLSALVEKCID